MKAADNSFPNTVNRSRAPLPFNPTVVVGMGAFGGVVLRMVARRVEVTHPALFDGSGWLWLSGTGWRGPPSEDAVIDPAGEGVPLVGIDPEPLSQACERAIGQFDDVGYTLDIFVVARADDPFVRGTLWPLLESMRTGLAPQAMRVTLVLATDSRRFAGLSAPTQSRFFDELAERLVADRADSTPGAIAWCYLCDTLDADGRLLDGGPNGREGAACQADLVGAFLALLAGSELRCERAYGRTAIPKLARDRDLPASEPLVSTFGWGAFVLPADRIATLARDRLALELHEIAFPPKAEAADREAGWFARERLLAAADLSPKGLGERLLRGPDGSPVDFDSTPPDLAGLEPLAALHTLDRWRNDLQARWADGSASPPGLVERNAGAFLAEISAEIEREVNALLAGDRRGPHRASAFLNELPQAIEEARVETLAEDRYYRRLTVPSADEKLKELAELVADRKGRLWRDLALVSIAFVLLMAAVLWRGLGIWPYALGAGLAGLALVWFRERWLRPRGLAGGQADFIAAVQMEFAMAQEREMRVERRGLFDAALKAVRQERGALLSWKKAIKQARVDLTEAGAAPHQPACGERLVCDPADFPSPLDEHDAAAVAELAEKHLDPAGLPDWREGDAGAIVAWLRGAAEDALAGWRRGITVTDWHDPDPAQALDDLVADVRLRWPLEPGASRPIELSVVGLPEQSLPELDLAQHAIAVTTGDVARLSYTPMVHGLRLKQLGAFRALTKQ